MIKKVYIDTSVVGGNFDEEFKFWTELFFKEVKNGQFQIVISEHLINELMLARDNIKYFLDSIPDEHKLYIEYTKEAKELAELYLKEKIVGPSSVVDCRHIATATVNNIEVLTSWNFKHIVNLNKIRLYNAVNIKGGYRNIEIRTPREILNYEN
ncbi:MAG: hypothetical protein KF845_13125 [Cyclobacteriaceae bacterium]|nr:hypothetical protein [Cyclobacteriaceae bacterium]